jgi:hypothetical protein
MDAVSVCWIGPVAGWAWDQEPARTVEGITSKGTHLSAWLKASGSEATASRGPRDALMRILSVAVADVAKVVAVMKRSVAEGRGRVLAQKD